MQKTIAYTMTYAFPFMHNNHVVAVGAIDINMNYIWHLFQKWNRHGEIKLYFKISKYANSPTPAGFYRFNKHYQLVPFQLSSAPKNISTGHWAFHHFKLYGKVSYLYGGFDFLAVINLIPVLSKILITTLIGLLLLALGLLLGRKIIYRRLNQTIRPITDLTNHMTNILSTDPLDKKIHVPARIKGHEIKTLYQSAETMRLNFCQLLKTQHFKNT